MVVIAIAETVRVNWRVTQWELTDDNRWKVAAVSHHGKDWSSALVVAREWFGHQLDEVEQGRIRIKVDPVNAPRGLLRIGLQPSEV